MLYWVGAGIPFELKSFCRLMWAGVHHRALAGGVVSKAEEYRARAAECEEKATEATDVEAKRLLQEAAIE